MGNERKKKFLLKSNFQESDNGLQIRQGYLNRARQRTVRVRTIDDKAFLTVKGVPAEGTNPEFEYDIPLDEANTLLETLCERTLIEKVRHRIEHQGLTWEVDVFGGKNEGLAFAEIELEQADQAFGKPKWIGEEVTGDPRYFNSRLSETPFREWSEAYSVVLYFEFMTKAKGRSLAARLRDLGYPVVDDNWSDASEPGDGPLFKFAEVNTIHFHPSAAAKAVQIRDDLAPDFALKEGDILAPGTTWSVGPRQIVVLVPATPST